MKKKFVCEDEYEAQKLASLIYVKQDNETFISGVLEIVENEIIVSLKDKSAHSILLKDKFEVENFADFIQSIVEKKHKIRNTEISKNTVEITKD
jgi:hypothetical protein